jgi:hypothetical protein
MCTVTGNKDNVDCVEFVGIEHAMWTDTTLYYSIDIT